MIAVRFPSPRHWALIFGLMVLATLARAQSIAYSIPVHGPTAVVAPQRLGVLRALPAIGDVQLDLLPGFAAENGAPALGFALSRALPMGPDLDLALGVHAVVVQGIPASYGLYVGLTWRVK